jgi:hypothetical protein
MAHYVKERAFLPTLNVPPIVVEAVRAGLLTVNDLEEAGYGIWVEPGTPVTIVTTMSHEGQVGHVIALPDGREVASFDGLIEEVADVTAHDWDEFEISLSDYDEDDDWL